MGINGEYHDSGLPEGVINADISSKDGSIIYSLTQSGTDNSALYVRDSQGRDRLILEGDKNIFSWVRWSPNGDKIVFLKSDLMINSDSRRLMVINSDGTGLEKISGVLWGYPPVWSPDGSKIAFGNASNIWEYDANAKSLNKLTNFDRGTAFHPTYSEDGKTVMFSSDVSGKKQVWSVKDGQAVQLTNDDQEKNYPILP